MSIDLTRGQFLAGAGAAVTALLFGCNSSEEPGIVTPGPGQEDPELADTGIAEEGGLIESWDASVTGMVADISPDADRLAVTTLGVGSEDNVVVNLDGGGARVELEVPEGENINGVTTVLGEDGSRYTLAAAQSRLFQIGSSGVRQAEAASILEGRNLIGALADLGDRTAAVTASALERDFDPALSRFTNGALLRVRPTSAGLELIDAQETSGVNPTGILRLTHERLLVLNSGNFQPGSAPTLDIFNLASGTKTTIGTLPGGHTFQLGSTLAVEGNYIYLGTADNSGVIVRVSLSYPYTVTSLTLPRTSAYAMHNGLKVINGRIFIDDQANGKIYALDVTRFDDEGTVVDTRELQTFDGNSLVGASVFTGTSVVSASRLVGTFYDPSAYSTAVVGWG